MSVVARQKQKYLFGLLLLFAWCYAAPIGRRQQQQQQQRQLNDANSKIMSTLSGLGYTAASNLFGQLQDEVGAFTQAVSVYQRIWRLNVTGVVDNDTAKLLAHPRCGNSDDALVLKAKGLSRKKRYVLDVPWPKMHLTYHIVTYSNKSNLTNEQIDDAISTAMNTWARSSDLTFNMDRINPDIEIRFASLDHRPCPYPFDGRGGVLAHAYHPLYGGDLHVDDNEPWKYQDEGGREITVVALHELGHALGLQHSNVIPSVMYPFYNYTKNVTLFPDDIQAIRALYSLNQGQYAGTMEAWCVQPVIDAIVATVGPEIYIFRGDEFVIMDKKGIAKNFPLKITQVFTMVKNGVDASLVLPTVYGCTSLSSAQQIPCMMYDLYLFQGNSYYLYRDSVFIAKGEISDVFRGIPGNLDSAFLRKDGLIYFTKGTAIWAYARHSGVVSGFPTNISLVFKGLPDRLEGATYIGFQATDKVVDMNFFFQDDSYYEIDGLYDFVALDNKNPFPRNISQWWFDCSGYNMQQLTGAGFRNLISPDLTPISTQMITQNMLIYLKQYNVTFRGIDGPLYDKHGNVLSMSWDDFPTMKGDFTVMADAQPDVLLLKFQIMQKMTTTVTFMGLPSAAAPVQVVEMFPGRSSHQSRVGGSVARLLSCVLFACWFNVLVCN